MVERERQREREREREFINLNQDSNIVFIDTFC